METQQPWIYESPDGGKTVYRRAAGDEWSTRELTWQDQDYLQTLRMDLKMQSWRDVVQAAESDPVLADLLERAECYYRLKHA